MDRQSLLTIASLPEGFGLAILLVSLALTVAPYLPGLDIGSIKIPSIQPSAKKALQITGPLLLLAAIFIHVPLVEKSHRRPSFTYVPLRETATTLSADEVVAMARNRGFSIPGAGLKGDFVHAYRLESGGETIADEATGLMWQRSGSKDPISYGAAQTYVAQLNREKFGGFDDWRLPTIEELVSLLEPESENGSFLDPKFSRDQSYCRSVDKAPEAGYLWGIVFGSGQLYRSTVDFHYWVRAVRSMSQR